MDKQLFKIEYARMKDRIHAWKWWCHFYDVKCVAIILATIAITISYFIV